ncbi:hypothetical protein NMY22_g15644 [Coprinellus aureogranulatus]|nr:hypothetical protein NMY22_g15644 [Coprinellus aureogranulatus]
MSTPSKPTSSEDIIGQKYDRCLADLIVKAGVGFGAGVVGSVILFKRRTWPIALGTGFGAGAAYADCDRSFNPALIDSKRGHASLSSLSDSFLVSFLKICRKRIRDETEREVGNGRGSGSGFRTRSEDRVLKEVGNGERWEGTCHFRRILIPASPTNTTTWKIAASKETRSFSSEPIAPRPIIRLSDAALLERALWYANEDPTRSTQDARGISRVKSETKEVCDDAVEELLAASETQPARKTKSRSRKKWKNGANPTCHPTASSPPPTPNPKPKKEPKEKDTTRPNQVPASTQRRRVPDPMPWISSSNSGSNGSLNRSPPHPPTSSRIARKSPGTIPIIPSCTGVTASTAETSRRDLKFTDKAPLRRYVPPAFPVTELVLVTSFLEAVCVGSMGRMSGIVRWKDGRDHVPIGEPEVQPALREHISWNAQAKPRLLARSHNEAERYYALLPRWAGDSSNRCLVRSALISTFHLLLDELLIENRLNRTKGTIEIKKPGSTEKGAIVSTFFDEYDGDIIASDGVAPPALQVQIDLEKAAKEDSDIEVLNGFWAPDLYRYFGLSARESYWPRQESRLVYVPSANEPLTGIRS